VDIDASYQQRAMAWRPIWPSQPADARQKQDTVDSRHTTPASASSTMGAGTIFRLGEQKLNDFSVRGAKIGEKQSRQSNSKYNFMQYIFFETDIPVRSVQ